MLRIGLLLSGRGRGTNMQAILDACASGYIPGQVALVLIHDGERAGAGAGAGGGSAGTLRGSGHGGAGPVDWTARWRCGSGTPVSD